MLYNIVIYYAKQRCDIVELGYNETKIIKSNEDYPFNAFWFWLTRENPIGCELHFHNQIEFIFVAAGQLEILLNNERVMVYPEHFIMIHANESHKIVNCADVTYYFGVRFDPSVLYSTAQTVFELKCLIAFCVTPGNRQRIFHKDELDPSVRTLLETAANEFERKEFGYTFSIRNKINSIFLMIIKNWRNQGLLNNDNISGEMVSAINYAQNYIAKNYADVNEAELANKCNMSYSYFSRSFKKVMGMSFNEYVNRTRLNEAQRMLVLGNNSISQIAETLGFSSASHFIRTFKASNGITPNQFKQSYVKQRMEPDD